MELFMVFLVLMYALLAAGPAVWLIGRVLSGPRSPR